VLEGFAISIDQNQVAFKRNVMHFERAGVFGDVYQACACSRLRNSTMMNVSRVPDTLQRLDFSARERDNARRISQSLPQRAFGKFETLWHFARSRPEN